MHQVQITCGPIQVAVCRFFRIIRTHQDPRACGDRADQAIVGAVTHAAIIHNSGSARHAKTIKDLAKALAPGRPLIIPGPRIAIVTSRTGDSGSIWNSEAIQRRTDANTGVGEQVIHRSRIAIIASRTDLTKDEWTVVLRITEAITIAVGQSRTHALAKSPDHIVDCARVAVVADSTGIRTVRTRVDRIAKPVAIVVGHGRSHALATAIEKIVRRTRITVVAW